MGISGGPNILGDENLVFIYDTGDGNSYFGPPTTNNYGTSFKDLTGTSYGYGAEWASNPTQFTKTYYPNLSTPIGLGATLIEESGGNGFHHISSYGGGSESGAESLSCYLYPLSNGITDFTIGLLGDGGNMISFNLNTKVITYGGGITNRNAIIQDVPGAPGWLRVGANFEGRAGGWVGCLGYSINTTYTGTAGAKKCYITGIQYEFKTFITPFTPGTRSISGSLFDLSSNKYQLTLNTSYSSSNEISFDGTDDYIDTNSTSILSGTGDFTIESFYNMTGQAGGAIFVNFGTGYSTGLWFSGQYGIYLQGSVYAPGAPLPNGKYHMVATRLSGVVTLYRNGVSVASGTLSSAIPSNINYRIGADVNGAAEPFTGQIYNLKVYNRALTASEVLQNYNSQKSRFNL